MTTEEQKKAAEVKDGVSYAYQVLGSLIERAGTCKEERGINARLLKDLESLHTKLGETYIQARDLLPKYSVNLDKTTPFI